MFATDELAVDFLFWEVVIAVGSDDWWLCFFLHDDGHEIILRTPLVHVFGGLDHPRSYCIV